MEEPVEESAGSNTPGNTSGSNAQAPSSGSNSNTGGNSNTQAPSQPQQPSTPNVCTPNGTYGRLGNSGRWFSSMNEAENWAWDYLDAQAFPVKYHGYHAWTIIDSCGVERNDLWTIDFY